MLLRCALGKLALRHAVRHALHLRHAEPSSVQCTAADLQRNRWCTAAQLQRHRHARGHGEVRGEQ